jgi:hypothetical protein
LFPTTLLGGKCFDAAGTFRSVLTRCAGTVVRDLLHAIVDGVEKLDQPVFRRRFPIPLLAMSNTTSFGYPVPLVRKVSALRQRMTDDMTVRNFAPNTQVSYLSVD